MKKNYADVIERVLEGVRTTEDVSLIDEGLADLEGDLYRASEKTFAQRIEEKMPEHLAERVKEAISGPSIGSAKEDIHEFLTDLRRAVKSMKVLRLEIAFQPTGAFIDTLAGWTKKELGRGIVIEFSLDKNILGGVRIVFGGRYSQRDLGSLIEDAMERERASIMVLFKSTKVLR